MATYPNVNAATKYARDVVAGRIPAARITKAACQRHLDDLKSQKDPAYPYRFDRDKGERVCKFIQLLVHTKGEWAKRPLHQRRIVLEPWQLFAFSTLFGWTRKKDKLRRFREAYICVPRKNGKSIIAAGVGLYALVGDGESGAEVYCGASSEYQAWKVFQPALQMVRALPNLRSRFGLTPWAKKLTLMDGSVFEPVIGDPGDGSSPHLGIVDEFHEHDDSGLYDTMLTGMGARLQGLMLAITTAGDNIESPCFDMHTRVVEMLDGAVGNEDDELFGLIYTIDPEDDWTSTLALQKANPNYGVSVYEDFLLSQQSRGKRLARFANKFKTRHLNIWVSAKDGFFNLESWRRCEDKGLTLDRFEGWESIMSFDLARKLDLTAKVRLYKQDIDGRRHYYCVAPRFWVPEDTVWHSDNRKQSERYRKWVNTGHLTATEGAEVDYREILAAAVSAHHHSPSVGCPIDPHGAANLSHQMMDEGLQPITISQNYTNLSDPMKELEAAIESGRFHHDGNPIMTWCISNVIGKHIAGNDDVVRPIKQGNDNKIDGAVALIMAVGRAMLGDTEKPKQSIYDTSDVTC
jgi:phage terminase large subunit-like protein